VYRFSNKILFATKALRQLGYRSISNYARYQMGLRSGFYRKLTPAAGAYRPFKLTQPEDIPIFIPSKYRLSSILGDTGTEQAITEADEVTSGKVRLFGGEAVPLHLGPPGHLAHWTDHELGKIALDVADIKFIWEPARFGWAFTLGRAYILSGDDKYARSFWRQAEKFLLENPPHQGPNWMSAQEAALRLTAFAFSLKAFANSAESTAERVNLLAGAIACHAERIPPTISYARAQNNNHLLTEAAGLFTAGCVLNSYPAADTWRMLGWEWFNEGIMNQVDDNGGYTQQSVNYHRLMLQTALWMHMLISVGARSRRMKFPDKTSRKLASAVNWLERLVDKETGHAPNLGPNDGAYIFPLTSLPFCDHRPVLQAASSAFLGTPLFEPGTWDEMMVWCNCSPGRAGEASLRIEAGLQHTPHILTSPYSSSWAYLRAAQFSNRPGHADQLHLDLWWRGMNIALDPGTYLYNAPSPWENSLAHTEVHNTITVDGEDQMTRAGRFLWLDWGEGRVLPHRTKSKGCSSLLAEHTGYKRKDILHRREAVTSEDGSWIITDHLLPYSPSDDKAQVHLYRLHWLLPDWNWELDKIGLLEGPPELFAYHLRLQSPLGWISLNIEADKSDNPKIPALLLARAGETLAGEGKAAPHWGWYSPTYAHKLPALSLSLTSLGTAPYKFVSRWLLPGEPDQVD
jgi:hypothetical protein